MFLPHGQTVCQDADDDQAEHDGGFRQESVGVVFALKDRAQDTDDQQVDQWEVEVTSGGEQSSTLCRQSGAMAVSAWGQRIMRAKKSKVRIGSAKAGR